MLRSLAWAAKFNFWLPLNGFPLSLTIIAMPSGMVMLAMFGQFAKAFSPIVKVLPLKTTAVKLAQLEKASFGISVTLSGIVIEVIPLSANAVFPILRTDLGRVIDLSGGQFRRKLRRRLLDGIRKRDILRSLRLLLHRRYTRLR
jgi:hypothetical protein